MSFYKHSELIDDHYYRCVVAPIKRRLWIGSIRLTKDWPKSTTARYEKLCYKECLSYLRSEKHKWRRFIAKYAENGSDEKIIKFGIENMKNIEDRLKKLAFQKKFDVI